MDRIQAILDWLRNTPGVADQLQASHQRFQDVAGTQGLAAAMRDPVHNELGQQAAGSFDFTGGMGLGLGMTKAVKSLDMSQAARMARAADQGFAVDAYKGMHPYDYRTSEYDPKTGAMIKAGPQLSEINNPSADHAGFFSSSPEVASRFAMALDQDGGAVYPTKLKFNNPVVIDAGGKPAAAFQFASLAREHGTSEDYAKFSNAFSNKKIDGVILRGTKDEGDVYIPRSPSQVRSVHAAFDPKKAKSADLLASIAAAGLLGAGAYGAADDTQPGLGLGR